MKFAPKTEEELEVMSLLEPGIYQFEVTQSADEKSKSGNDMIKLGLTVWGKDGSPHFVYDYLLEAMAHKIRHFCSNSGLMVKYESGELCAMDCLNKQGFIEVVIQEGKINPQGGKYPNRNSVKDYVKGDYSALKATNSDSVEDDVPF